MGLAAGDANLYRYCGNSPVNWVDPSGLLPGAVTLTFACNGFLGTTTYGTGGTPTRPRMRLTPAWTST